MEEVKVVELPEKYSVESADYIIVEDQDGTKKTRLRNFRSLLINSLYFNSVDELKNSPNSNLKEGDICQTLGFYTPGDGGGAIYRVIYNPAAVEDGKLIHYLSYSDTLRLELISDETINVHQLGAVGDGVTDDADAIQCALNNFKVINFNNMHYHIRKPLEINQNNQRNIIINGNKCKLFGNYTDGIIICDNSDININDLYFDSTKFITTIHISNCWRINILNCNLEKVSNKGINIENSLFININNCYIAGNKTSNLIELNGSNKPLQTGCNRLIDITNCTFNGFKKAININTCGVESSYNEGTSVNINNCRFMSNDVGQYCIYINCEINSVVINSIILNNIDTFLYFSAVAKGQLSCSNVAYTTVDKLFDIQSTESIIDLSGFFKPNDTFQHTSQSQIVFENMAGKLNSNVLWNVNKDGTYPACFNNRPTGVLCDSTHPLLTKNSSGMEIINDLNSNNCRLKIHSCINMKVDIDKNLNQINNGIKGQVLYVYSSNNSSIISVLNNIELSQSSIQLGKYKGVLIEFDGTKWVQIG